MERAAPVLLVLASTGILAAESPIDPEEMLRHADASHDAFSEGVIRLSVAANEPRKPPQVSELELFVKGTDRTLLIFREGKQKGRKILTQEDRVFLIVPGASRSIPVSKSQRLMGAASYGDLARLRLADEYDATVRPGAQTVADASGGTVCLVLDLTAKRAGSAYPKAVLWIGRDDGLARRLYLVLASGKDAKEVSFQSYDRERRIATMAIRDLLTAGGANVTLIVFEAYESRLLDPAIFTPEGARAVP